MSILTKEEIAKYALLHGKLFTHSCDEPNCGRMIRAGELCVVLKWKKRTDGTQALMGRLADKVRCMVCERNLRPLPDVVKVVAAGRGAKKVSQEIASTIQINIPLRKLVLRLLKATPEGIPVKVFQQRLRKKKMVRELAKKDFATTIRGLRKLKLIRVSKGNFMLAKQNKARKKVNA